MAKKQAAKAINPKLYDVLRTPVITEKSTMLGEQNKVVFKVAKSVTKSEIKQAVEALFNVKVTSVNTVNLPAKTKRFRGAEGTRSGVRKAIVSLAEGQNVDVMSGV